MIKYKIKPLATFKKSDGSDCPKDLAWAWDTENPIYKQVKSFTGGYYGMIEQWKFPTAAGDFTKIKIEKYWSA